MQPVSASVTGAPKQQVLRRGGKENSPELCLPQEILGVADFLVY